jgi:DNA segregation ATPase FtsK/SpoIIIE-like protein
MLYMPGGTPIPVRVHGAFVDDDEVHRVVESWKTLAEEVTWHYENNVFDYPKSVYDIGSIHIGFGND